MTYTEKLLGGDPRDKDAHLSSGDRRQPTGSADSIWHEPQVNWNRYNQDNNSGKEKKWWQKIWPLRRKQRKS